MEGFEAATFDEILGLTEQNLHATLPLARPVHDDADACEWNSTNGIFLIWRRRDGDVPLLHECGQWPTEQEYDLAAYPFLH